MLHVLHVVLLMRLNICKHRHVVRGQGRTRRSTLIVPTLLSADTTRSSHDLLPKLLTAWNQNSRLLSANTVWVNTTSNTTRCPLICAVAIMPSYMVGGQRPEGLCVGRRLSSDACYIHRYPMAHNHTHALHICHGNGRRARAWRGGGVVLTRWHAADHTRAGRQPPHRHVRGRTTASSCYGPTQLVTVAAVTVAAGSRKRPVLGRVYCVMRSHSAASQSSKLDV